MNKIILIILAIISILIIVLGFVEGNNLRKELKAESEITEPIYIDGSDITEASIIFVKMGSWLMGFVIVIYSVGIVAAIWIVYGLVRLTLHIVNRKKAKTKE